MSRKLRILSILGCHIFNPKFYMKKFFDIDIFRTKGGCLRKLRNFG